MQLKNIANFTLVVSASVLFEGCIVSSDDTSLESSASRGEAPLLRAPPDRAIPGQYVVMLHEGTPSSVASELVNTVVAPGTTNSVSYRYSVIPAFAGSLDMVTVATLRRDPNVAYIQEDEVVAIDTTYPAPADGIDRSDQRLGHDGTYDDHGRDGAGTHIYILDTGLNTQHNEFVGRIGNGFTAIEDGGGMEDCNGHGTHVASTAAGTQYGMAKQATVHPVRVLGCNGSGTFAGVIAGVDFVHTDCPLQTGPCVANMSLSGGVYTPLNQAVANAVAGGVTFAVAAGNDNGDACAKSPASEPSAITVAAIDDFDERAWFSNYGACVDIFAPGVSILGAYIGSTTATKSLNGTSMASPHVAGAAAQFLSSNPAATPVQVANMLQGSANLDCVIDPNGSPNVLLFNDFAQGNYYCINTASSCEGLCGGPGDGCFCDPACLGFGDCCPDYQEVCN